MKKIRPLLVLIALLSIASCTAQPAKNTEPAAYDILGKWEYTLTTPDGNEYDNGTMEFTGTSDQGNWTQLNFYNVEYTGTYSVTGDAISLVGDATWQGHFVDTTHMSGEWQNNEASGEWTAVKK
ncbi:MAG: hypothetical protein HYZ22_08965 [Chloroflexi bacterium]|nr:hypothetical protein [Chloroflexota bacterium]